ncbi:MAG: hypothetical protein QM500_19870 [Methylococcales bacterium]
MKTETSVSFQPKGGMCATCQFKLKNCSHLDFSSMPVIQRTDNAHIVRCAEFDKS